MASDDVPKKTMATGVLGLPVNKKGEYLITLRHEPEYPEADNKWQITGGGMEFGETPEQTLAREIQEELSVSVRILFPHPIIKTWVWQLEEDFHVTLICYVVDIGDQKVKVDREENIDYQWIKPAAIHQLECLPLTDEFLFEAEKLVKKQDLLSMLQ